MNVKAFITFLALSAVGITILFVQWILFTQMYTQFSSLTFRELGKGW